MVELTKAAKARAVERVMAGERRKDVAREYGVTRGAVDDWVSRAQAEAEAEAVRAGGGVLHPAMLGKVMGL